MKNLCIVSKTLEGYPFVLLSDKPVPKTVGGFKLDKTTKERLKNFQVGLLHKERCHVKNWRNNESPNRRPAA